MKNIPFLITLTAIITSNNYCMQSQPITQTLHIYSKKLKPTAPINVEEKAPRLPQDICRELQTHFQKRAESESQQTLTDFKERLAKISELMTDKEIDGAYTTLDSDICSWLHQHHKENLPIQNELVQLRQKLVLEMNLRNFTAQLNSLEENTPSYSYDVLLQHIEGFLKPYWFTARFYNENLEQYYFLIKDINTKKNVAEQAQNLRYYQERLAVVRRTLPLKEKQEAYRELIGEIDQYLDVCKNNLALSQKDILQVFSEIKTAISDEITYLSKLINSVETRFNELDDVD